MLSATYSGITYTNPSMIFEAISKQNGLELSNWGRAQEVREGETGCRKGRASLTGNATVRNGYWPATDHGGQKQRERQEGENRVMIWQAVQDDLTHIGWQRLGSLYLAAHSMGRQIPRHLCFHGERNREETKNQRDQRAASPAL